MQEPVIANFEDMVWESHPVIAGIETKMIVNTAGYAPDDILIARVAAGDEIPWHVHENQSELVYVLQGTGEFYCAEDERHQQTSRYLLKMGTVIVVPPGVWHSASSTGDSELIALAAHAAQ